MLIKASKGSLIYLIVLFHMLEQNNEKNTR